MTGSKLPSPTTRRTVLGTLAALAGTTGLASATQQELDVDADNLVAGNSRFTITVEGVRGDTVQSATVTIGGISFATVEVLERDPAVLVVDPSNVIESESIHTQNTVEVTVRVVSGGEEFVGTDESQVIAD